MTRVSFYLLPDDARESRHLVACRLADKAYSLGHGVYVNTADEAETAALDERLWTFRDARFVPHVPAAEDDRVSPVLIGHDAGADSRLTDVMINVTEDVPDGVARFARVMELVGAGEAERRRGRERFRFYRDQGYELETHELASRQP